MATACEFKTSEASSKARLRTLGIIDDKLIIKKLNDFRTTVTRWSAYAKETYGISERLFTDEQFNNKRKAVPNKIAFKKIDNAKGIFYQFDKNVEKYYEQPITWGVHATVLNTDKLILGENAVKEVIDNLNKPHILYSIGKRFLDVAENAKRLLGLKNKVFFISSIELLIKNNPTKYLNLYNNSTVYIDVKTLSRDLLKEFDDNIIPQEIYDNIQVHIDSYINRDRTKDSETHHDYLHTQYLDLKKEVEEKNKKLKDAGNNPDLLYNLLIEGRKSLHSKKSFQQFNLKGRDGNIYGYRFENSILTNIFKQYIIKSNFGSGSSFKELEGEDEIIESQLALSDFKTNSERIVKGIDYTILTPAKRDLQEAKLKDDNFNREEYEIWMNEEALSQSWEFSPNSSELFEWYIEDVLKANSIINNDKVLTKYIGVTSSEILEKSQNKEYKHFQEKIQKIKYILSHKDEFNNDYDKWESSEGDTLSPMPGWFINAVTVASHTNNLNFDEIKGIIAGMIKTFMMWTAQEQYDKFHDQGIETEFQKLANTTNISTLLPEGVILGQPISLESDFSILNQLKEVPASTSSPETLSKIKEAAKKMGINIQTLVDYVKGNPNVNTKGISGLADLVKGVIAIAQGMEDVALTEEFVHIATAMLEQTNPKLITELISKIDRFKIYKIVLDSYGKRKDYQLSNGKPDIRKIKKEAVDKLIAEVIINSSEGSTEFPELMQENNRSMIRTWWNNILDAIRGMYRKVNIDIFNLAAEKIVEGELGTIEDIKEGEIYYQLSKQQENIQKKLIETSKTLQKVESKEAVDPIFMDTEEASNWYEILKTDGTWERVKNRVTDRVKRWYKQKFPNKTFSPEEKEFNELKRTEGVKGHNFLEQIHNRWFNSDGTRKEKIDSRPILTSKDEDVYNKLEKYYAGLINKFSENGKTILVFSEVMLYDPKERGGEAGTLDLLIIEESGRANNFDWKFMSTSDKAKDIAWFKQGAFNIQLGRYKEMLVKNYDVKEIGMNRAIPIIMEFTTNKKKVQELKGIVVGSVDPSKIENIKLVPVSEETESTGHIFSDMTPEEAKAMDKLISDLNAVYRQIGKKTATTDEEKEFKTEILNTIKEAIRLAHGTENIAPLIEVIKDMRKQGEQIINDYKTIYEKQSASSQDLNDKQLSEFSERMREYIAMAKIFEEAPRRIGDLIYTPAMEKNAKTKEQKEEMAFRKSVLTELEHEATQIWKSRDEIKELSGKFADKFIGLRNLVTGLLDPKAVVKGLSATFRGLSDLPLPSLQILYKLVENAKAKGAQSALEEVNELLVVRDKLKARGGDLRKLVQQIYQKDDNGLVNKLIYKFDKNFFTTIDDNAKEGAQSIKTLKDSIDVEAYKEEANKHLQNKIADIKRKYGVEPLLVETLSKEERQKYNEDLALMERLIREERQKWDIDNKSFNGWNNYIIKRHPQEKWYSAEYKELSKDADLLSLYNFITKMNDKALDAGYLQNQGHAIFLPFVRKTMAESLAWDFSLSAVANWKDSFFARADDVGYGSVNEFTREMEYSIPKYYTQDFTRNEDNIHDYSDVSEDLFKNMILYINHMEKYSYLTDVEGQLQLVKTIETFKGHLNTNRNGEVVYKDGKAVAEPGNAENAKIFDDFLRAALYEQKYPLSDTDMPLGLGKVKNYMKMAVNNVVGKEVWKIDENPTPTSLLKTMDSINRWYQVKTLGLEFISGSVNIFGGNMQIAAQAGNYFKGSEVMVNEAKLIGNKFAHTDEREMFVQLVDKFMPLKDDPTYDKLRKAGMSVLTRQNFVDLLMVFMRDPEQHLEKSVFLTLLQNTMIEDGKIVSIREFVKNKYKDRYDSANRYRQVAGVIDEEIETLKKTRSIDAIKKLENGKLVISGLDLDNIDELQRLTNLTRRISRNATGAFSNSDLNRMSMNIWTKSMMVFKNWIPKLVDTRFSEFRRVSDDFSVQIDENGISTGDKYDIGRIRLWGYIIGTSIKDKTSNLYNIISLNEQGLKALNEMYEDFAEKYKLRTGEEMNISKEDFFDMIRTNLQNQVKELTMLLSLFGAMLAMGFMAPDDDKDRATKNAYRFSQRVIDKFVGELSFFYNPAEFQRMLSGSAFPAIGVFTDVEKFIKHFFMETTGLDLSNTSLTPEEVMKKAQPIKYASKMLPFTKSMITYLSLFDADFAKEFDITIQKQSNR